MGRNTKKAVWVIFFMLVALCASTYMFYRNNLLEQKKEAISSELRLTQSKLNREQKEIVNLLMTIDSTVDKYKELASQHDQLQVEYDDLLKKIDPNQARRNRKNATTNTVGEGEHIANQLDNTNANTTTTVALTDETSASNRNEEITPVPIKEIPKFLSFNGKRLRKGESINLDVKFAPNSDVLTDTFEVSKLVTFLKDHPNLIIKLSGHTQSNPPKDHPDYEETIKMHLELSKRRVEFVGHFLKGRGVNPKQIRTAYFGGSKPRYAVSRLNRRVEMEVVSQ